ncbi:tRNA (adenosine(37)-N6)-threonylcarbamoyltransferase complex ATPase subunit type 1 TsaE [Candidatus Kaiserbacteria bacterium]|nr:tRNA (adenosine(37)-N6)-threonylcarbamoyltransferase complex ATPase subunit type 1 TsaE [Candidatus Kaiserbacteria bacterium]
MDLEQQYLVAKPEDFKPLIKQLIESESDNLIIALEGDLGAGKTTFTQELGKCLGVEEVITSPTFTIMKQYNLSDKKFKTLVHIDAYRIESEAEVEPLHIKELLENPNTVICIEWPENIREVIPSTAKKVTISISEGEQRQVTLSHF